MHHLGLPPPDTLLPRLRALGFAIQSAVNASLRRTSTEGLSAVKAQRGGDTIYALDVDAEEILLKFCSEWGAEVPFVLVAEGLEAGHQVFPAGVSMERCRFTLIVDPVDGTRGLMYGKRSAWSLLAVAPPPRPGAWPTLADVEVALQVELPTARAALSDVLWAIRGQGVWAETHDMRTGAVSPYVPHPSTASTLAGGFASFAMFFPGTLEDTAAVAEQLYAFTLDPAAIQQALVFNDQYISTGGQLYELIVGHDRFVADIRPLVYRRRGGPTGLTCHPYDIVTWIIAEEAGVVVTDLEGKALSQPLDTTTPVGWIGYANETLRSSVEPRVQEALRAIHRGEGSPR